MDVETEHAKHVGPAQEFLVRSAPRDLAKQVEIAERCRQREVQAALEGRHVELKWQARRRPAERRGQR